MYYRFTLTYHRLKPCRIPPVVATGRHPLWCRGPIGAIYPMPPAIDAQDPMPRCNRPAPRLPRQPLSPARRLRRTGPAALVLAALLGGAAGGPAAAQDDTQPAGLRQAETVPPAGARPALPAISVAPVERRALRDIVHASGRVAPVETVQVQPLIEGQPIDALLVQVGDRVAEGQALARLSARTLDLERSQLDASRAGAVASIAQSEAQQAEAEASRDEARRVAERARRLREQGTASQAALDEAQASAIAAEARVNAAVQGLRAAQAQLALIEAQLADVDLRRERTTVVAPVAGIVTRRNAERGAIASAQNEPMFTLIRDGALELRADVAEQDLYRLAPGQPVTLNAAGLAAPVAGRVRLVEPAVDDTTRLGRVRIAIDDQDIFRQGQFAEAAILVAERETLAVPSAAVGLGPKGPQVLRITADHGVEAAPVTLGIREGAMVEIREGLFGGEQVVARAGAFVRPGDHVTPVSVAPTAPDQ